MLIINIIKKKKVLCWLGAFLLFTATIQFLNFTGFCYGNLRYLSEQELIDRFLFKEKAEVLTLEEKQEILQQRGSGIYPYAFWISGEPLDLSATGKFINKVFGTYYFELKAASPEKITSFAVNACASKSVKGYGEPISTEKYKSLIEDRENETTLK